MVGIQRVGYKQLREYLVNAGRCVNWSNLGRDWESCFFAQAVAGQLRLPRAGGRVVERWLDRQEADGFVPQCLDARANIDVCAEWNERFHCKPFLAQTLLQDIRSSVASFADYQHLLEPLCRYLCYYDSHRRSPLGLYYWISAEESGVASNMEIVHLCLEHAADNYNAGKSCSHPAVAVDLNSFLVLEFRAFADIAESCGRQALAMGYRVKAAELQGSINAHLWNESTSMFGNLDDCSDTTVQMRSWTGWLPAILGLTDHARLHAVIMRNILDEGQFLHSCGLSSLAQGEPLFSQASQVVVAGKVVDNWFGPMWILPNVLAVRCLLETGYRDQARQIARSVLNALRISLERTGGLAASYDVFSGRPLSHLGSLSWNLLALELMPLADEGFMAA